MSLAKPSTKTEGTKTAIKIPIRFQIQYSDQSSVPCEHAGLTRMYYMSNSKYYISDTVLAILRQTNKTFSLRKIFLSDKEISFESYNAQ